MRQWNHAYRQHEMTPNKDPYCAQCNMLRSECTFSRGHGAAAANTPRKVWYCGDLWRAKGQVQRNNAEDDEDSQNLTRSSPDSVRSNHAFRNPNRRRASQAFGYALWVRWRTLRCRMPRRPNGVLAAAPSGTLRDTRCRYKRRLSFRPLYPLVHLPSARGCLR